MYGVLENLLELSFSYTDLDGHFSYVMNGTIDKQKRKNNSQKHWYMFTAIAVSNINLEISEGFFYLNILESNFSGCHQSMV